MEKFESVEQEIVFNKLKSMLPPNESNALNLKSCVFNKEEYFKELDSYINILNRNRENHAYRLLTSHRKVIGPLIVFFKKIIRKVLKWYIEPITYQQTDFNNAVTPSIGRLTELVAQVSNDKDAMISRLENELKKNEDKFAREIKDQELRHQNVLEQLIRKQELLYQEVKDIDMKIAIQSDEIQHATYQLDKINDLDIFREDQGSIFMKKSFAQSGEDAILAYLCFVLGIPFESVVYLDLGANHAKEMSNTYFFYTKGAKGVLVEANPHLIPELKFFRHRDIILNRVIDNTPEKEVDFYVLNGDGLSTSNLEAVEEFCSINKDLKIVSQHKVKTIDYGTIIDDYLGVAPTILSIDIEGKDLEILKSIDFNNYRPKIIVIEMVKYGNSLSHKTKNKAIVSYLDEFGYDEYAFTGINSIFICRGFLNEREARL